MGFSDKVQNFFGLPSKKEMEQLKETVETQQRLLSDKNEAKPETTASMMAKESKGSSDPQGLVKKRVPVKDLQLLYLNNQLVFRAINVRADELVNRGYKVLGGDEKGRELCSKLIEDSGGINLFWELSVNCDVSGDGYLEKVPNISKTAIKKLKHINPVTFGFLTDPEDGNRIILNDKGLPKAYQQVFTNSEGKSDSKEVQKERIAHLRFNTFADEFTGISTIQPVYNTAIRLMNMEHAAAEAAVKTANPTWVVKTKTKSPMELGKWANTLGRISAQEVVFLPDGVDVELRSPGNENFSSYSDYFMDAVVASTGVPKSVLMGSSDKGGGNRSTVQTISKHFYSLIRSNQRYVQDLINQIFFEYGQMSGFKPPQLYFDDIAEDADRNGQRAIDLYMGGLITLEEAREIIGLDTEERIKKELVNQRTDNKKSNIDPDKEDKKNDAEAWHTAEPGSPQGSQKNNKKKQKIDPNVSSVK